MTIKKVSAGQFWKQSAAVLRKYFGRIFKEKAEGGVWNADE